MKILKEGRAGGPSAPGSGDMELINSYARGRLEEDKVYTFSLILCDNEVDRDSERFSTETLKELAKLFVGKTGISDHDWSSSRQFARIYRTEVVTDAGRKTAAGEDYAALKAWAYMLRTEENEAIIAEIEGGIKKETSVGCAVERCVCSICGKDMAGGECSHVKGRRYGGKGGKLCYGTLEGALDAYEWSFVAVPAQKGAGVTKTFAEPEGEALERLKSEAALGREYLGAMRRETLRLALICGTDLHKGLERAVETMDAEGLKAMKSALEARVAEMLPLSTQLPHGGEKARFDGEAYLV